MYTKLTPGVLKWPGESRGPQQQQMAGGIYSGYVLYSCWLMGALASLLSPKRFRLTVSPDFNQHYTARAASYSVCCVIWHGGGHSAALHLRRCTLSGDVHWIIEGSSVSIYDSFTVRSAVSERARWLDAQQ